MLLLVYVPRTAAFNITIISVAKPVDHLLLEFVGHSFAFKGVCRRVVMAAAVKGHLIVVFQNVEKLN